MYYTESDLYKHMNRVMESSYELAIEAKLTAAERKALPDDAFGLPK